MDDTPDAQAMPILPGLDTIEQRCWQQFLDCSLNLVAAVNMCLKGAHDLSIRDVMLLELLSQPDRRGHRLHALAAALRVSQGQLSAQIRRMESRGLVTRTPSRSDPRGILPRITGEGRTNLNEVLETYARGVRAHYLDKLQRDQMVHLVDSCRRINGSLTTVATRA